MDRSFQHIHCSISEPRNSNNTLHLNSEQLLTLKLDLWKSLFEKKRKATENCYDPICQSFLSSDVLLCFAGGDLLVADNGTAKMKPWHYYAFNKTSSVETCLHYQKLFECISIIRKKATWYYLHEWCKFTGPQVNDLKLTYCGEVA